MSHAPITPKQYHDEAAKLLDHGITAMTDERTKQDYARAIVFALFEISALLRAEKVEVMKCFQCPKCGSPDIHTRYFAKDEYFDYGDRKHLGDSQARSECLRRYCRGCQFAWLGPVLSESLS